MLCAKFEAFFYDLQSKMESANTTHNIHGCLQKEIRKIYAYYTGLPAKKNPQTLHII